MTENFRIENVTSRQLAIVKKILSVHTDMTYGIIARECGASAYLYLWCNQVIEYMRVKKNLDLLGVKQIEDKMAYYEKINKKMLDVFDRILSNQKF
mmetsp:Transcript_30241/g.26800  ORF Transcript_30241/g.26800 Transcript_30241/m.26800 type:complete len:96 (+) Transcript_30241:529-816(+)